MGSYAYSFLADSYLSDEREINACYAERTEDELRTSLAEYRHYILSTLDIQLAELRTDKETRVYIENRTPIWGIEKVLTDMALYADVVFLPDPVFELTVDRVEESSYFTVTDLKYNVNINRKRLACAVQTVMSLSVCYMSNYVIFIPSTVIDEPPNGWPVISVKQELFSDSMKNYFMERTRVEFVKTQEGKIIKVPNIGYKPEALRISLPDHGDTFVAFMNWEYLESVTSGTPKELFCSNRDGLVLSSASHYVEHLLREVELANSLSATFISTQDSSNKLLPMALGGPEESERTHTIKSELRIVVAPNLSLTEILNLRNSHARAFSSFRSEMKKDITYLSMASDDHSLKTGLNAMRSKYDAYSQDFVKLIKDSTCELGKAVVCGVISLVASFPASNSALSVASCLAPVLLEGDKVRKQITVSPYYFGWHLKRASKKYGG